MLLKNDIYTYKVARNVHRSLIGGEDGYPSPPVSRSLTTRLTTLKLPIVSSNRCLVDRTISRSSLSTAVSCSLVVPATARNNDPAERRKCSALAHTTQAFLFCHPALQLHQLFTEYSLNNYLLGQRSGEVMFRAFYLSSLYDHIIASGP